MEAVAEILEVPEEDFEATDTPCRPFVKNAGGKTQLLPILREWMPKRFSIYAEPFIGGGALFFATQPRHAILSDSNPWLIRTYKAVSNNLDEVIAALRIYADTHARCQANGTDEKFYYHARGFNPETMADVDAAALYIYLNKTCFNGLFRVNVSGKFNTPFGKRAAPNILDESVIRACSVALQRASISHRDFRETNLPAMSFCYFDPPYHPISDTSNFTGYTKDKFTEQDQRDLRDLALKLKHQGVYVLLSNSSAPLIRELYKDNFEIREIPARRNINSKGDGRGAITELLIR